MSDWQQVNVRVKESTHKYWKETAEAEYGGLSDLVRTAVRREIEGHHSGAQAGESAAESETVQEVLKAVDRLENTVDGIDNRLSVVRESVESSGPDYSFRAAVREIVPEDDEDALTAGQIAARLDARESDVKEALEDLQYTEEVRQTPEGESDEPTWITFEGV